MNVDSSTDPPERGVPDRTEGVPGSTGRHPTLPGRAPALETLTSSGTPLLAGFSVTMIGVIAQAEERFALPGPAMLALTIAAVLFVGSIHCAYWARVSAANKAEVQDYVSDDGPDDEVRAWLDEHRIAYLTWIRRLHLFFQLGVLALFVGIATALVPLARSPQAIWRWVAVAVCGSMFLFVLFWTFGFVVHRRVGNQPSGAVDRLVRWWFLPGRKPSVTATPARAQDRAADPDASSSTGSPAGH